VTIKVGSFSEAARFWLPNQAGVLPFLRELKEALMYPLEGALPPQSQERNDPGINSSPGRDTT
jgi:hypothetical protein